jgi:hypothetical protein
MVSFSIITDKDKLIYSYLTKLQEKEINKPLLHQQLFLKRLCVNELNNYYELQVYFNSIIPSFKKLIPYVLGLNFIISFFFSFWLMLIGVGISLFLIAPDVFNNKYFIFYVIKRNLKKIGYTGRMVLI